MTDTAELARKLAAVAPVIARLPQPTRARIGAKIVAGHMEHGETIRQIPTSEPESEVWDLLAYTAMLCEDVGIPRAHELRALVEHLLGRLLPAVEDLMGNVAARRKMLNEQEVRKAAKQAECRAKPAVAEKTREKPVQRKQTGIPHDGRLTGRDAQAIREALGLNKVQMAALVGVRPDWVRQVENKRADRPLAPELEKRYRKVAK